MSVGSGLVAKLQMDMACKYTEQDIINIRSRYANGETQTAISTSTGIRQGHISDICLRKVWKNVE